MDWFSSLWEGPLAPGRSQAPTTSSRGLCSPAQTLKVLKTVQGQDGPTGNKPEQRSLGHKDEAAKACSQGSGALSL